MAGLESEASWAVICQSYSTEFIYLENVHGPPSSIHKPGQLTINHKIMLNVYFKSPQNTRTITTLKNNHNVLIETPEQTCNNSTNIELNKHPGKFLVRVPSLHNFLVDQESWVIWISMGRLYYKVGAISTNTCHLSQDITLLKRGNVEHDPPIRSGSLARNPTGKTDLYAMYSILNSGRKGER